ncbi:MFS transporter [Archaeoglobales archaeon]|nr:MAG: MFS transporter [Archaeoglobales archaeon]
MNKRAFNVLFISIFSAMIGLGIVVPLLPFYAESLGATGIWIGAIFSGFSLARAIFMPIIGKISDRRGRKALIIFGLLIYTAISLAYIAANSVYSLTLVRIIHGMASAMVIPIAMAYIADLSPEGEEGKHMGTFTISLFLGMGFGPLFGGIIKDLAGMEAVFLSMAVFSSISLIICLVLLPDSKGSIIQPSLKDVIKNRMMKAVLFFRVMNSFAHGTFMVFLPMVASILIGLSPSQIGFLISVSVLTTATLQRYFGKMADKHKKSLLIVFGLVIVALSMITIPFLKGFAPLLVVSMLIGIGSSISIPSATAIVAIAGREVGQGSAMGAFNTAMSIGMITAPMVSGIVMDVVGVTHVFIFSGLICLFSAFIFWLIALKTGV